MAAPHMPAHLTRDPPRATRQVPRPGRSTLHLIDLANLVGSTATATATPRRCLLTLERYLVVSGWIQSDHAVLGLNPILARRIAWDLPQQIAVRCTPFRGHGHEALLAYARDVAQVTRSHTRIVIGSGNGVFAPICADLTARGIPTDVVARPDTCAGRLARHATQVLFLRPRSPAVNATRLPLRVTRGHEEAPPHLRDRAVG